MRFADSENNCGLFNCVVQRYSWIMPKPSKNQITSFAQTNFRSNQDTFGIKQQDRLFHTYIIGKTGTGKTTLLETMMRQDMEMGNGITFLDPHGDLAEKII